VAASFRTCRLRSARECTPSASYSAGGPNRNLLRQLMIGSPRFCVASFPGLAWPPRNRSQLVSTIEDRVTEFSARPTFRCVALASNWPLRETVPQGTYLCATREPLGTRGRMTGSLRPCSFRDSFDLCEMSSYCFCACLRLGRASRARRSVRAFSSPDCPPRPSHQSSNPYSNGIFWTEHEVKGVWPYNEGTHL
jgi:hypothetical protein